MPQMADITVKKNDGTTNVVYTALSPSSGDGTPAIWKSQTVGTAAAHQPELRLASRDAAKGARRALRGTYQYPQIATNTTTSTTSVIDRANADFNVNIPKGMATADVNEFVAQATNLFASALVVACLKAGYSAT
jgi:hypothetical protein